MKKYMMIMAALFVTLTMGAQEVKGSLDVLKGQSRLNVVEDWSRLKICDMDRAAWVKYRNSEQPDYDAEKELAEELQPRLREDMLPEANSKLNKKRIYLTQEPELKYTLVIAPLAIDKKGNQLVKCIVRETATGKEVASFKVDGDGGDFGSMSNLWGDGFRSSGKKLGKLLLKAMTGR